LSRSQSLEQQALGGPRWAIGVFANLSKRDVLAPVLPFDNTTLAPPVCLWIARHAVGQFPVYAILEHY
jgi:hypothetical protein